MTRKIDDRDFERADRLVRAEIDEALAVFRSGDLERRLRSRIAADGQPVPVKPSLMKIAVPAAALLLLASTAALVLFLTLRSPVPAPVDPGLMADVLGRFPSLSGPDAGPLPRRGGEERMSEAGGGFEDALILVERRKEEEERGSSVQDGKPAAPALSMKERMKILFKDKVIERALTLIAVKSKEA
jgi:hypothetical protein